MRRLCLLMLACLCVAASCCAADAQVRTPSPLQAPAPLLEAMYKCGMFDGSWGCRQVPGNVDHGKNANPAVAPAEAPEAAPVDPGALAPPVTPGPWSQSVEQEAVKPGEHSCPPGYKVLAEPGPYGYCEPPGTPAAVNTACERGMSGTPPNCACPKNSELLGGTCVHYTATCRNALAADAAPQVCMGAEEKLACKMRQDGLKDCCCLTYDRM